MSREMLPYIQHPEDYIMKENSNVYVILHHAYDESGTDYTEVMGVYTNVETAKKDLSLFFEEIDMGYEGYHVTESNCDTKMTIRADTWEYYDELEIVESPLVTE